METVAAVHGGEITAGSATSEALGRIERIDPSIGAFQVVRAAAALREARAVDARPDRGTLPLAGLPIAVMDNVPVRREPMRDRSSASDPAPQPADHEVVRRLRAAGAVVVGITRVPELCVFGATDSRFGVTRSPWIGAAPPVARRPGQSPRWRRAWWLQRTATTAWARSASQRPAAAWWG